jgi:hypothetical protein
MGKSMKGGMKKLINKVYLQNKEELTHTTQGKPKWDESFFKAARKDKEYHGNKY